MLAERDVAIRRLLVRGRGDGLRMGAHAGRLLAGASLHPPSLPPGAVAVVRRLGDPLPGRVQLSAAALRAPPDWERAVGAALDDRVRRAARPAAGAVPATADAVVFADRAELLACLAVDWLEGRASVRWWWVALGLAPRATARPAVAWLEEPRHVPAAFALLAERGLAVHFAERLADADVEALVSATALAYALPPGAVGSELGDRGGSRRSDGAPAAAAGPAAPAPRWAEAVPEAVERGLAPARRALLGVALALARAPALVRAPGFTEEVRSWRAPALSERRAEPESPRAATPETAGSPDGSLAAATRLSARAVGRADARTPPAAGSVDGEPEPQPPTTAGRPPAERRPATVGPVFGGPATLPSAPPPAHAPSAAPPAPAPSGAPHRIQGERAPARGEVTHTGLGGLFYLVNLGLFLGLYGDFTGSERGLALDPWDFVALVGAELLGARAPRDPAWGLLADLAGRERDAPPGRGFRAPRAWRLPRDWLAPFGPGGPPWRWSAEGPRLRIRHPGGFAVVDVTRRGPARGQLDRELRPYSEFAPPRLVAAPAHSVTPRNPLGAAPGVARWTAWVTAYARARLALGLGVRGRELPRVMLRRPALVTTSSARVDVAFQLDDLPLPIRLAGLDRDPGWMPAAGRSVHFVFR